MLHSISCPRMVPIRADKKIIADPWRFMLQYFYAVWVD